jgi:hypothetical protein
MKGHQDQYQKPYVQDQCIFFLPPKKQRIHLILFLILFCETYSQGLFIDLLNELIRRTDVFFKADPTVDEQAVLVAADTDEQRISTQPMGYNALNLKLREMCELIGLFLYNRIYVFRRDAASSTILEKGIEAAQKLLNHVADRVVF